MTFTYGFYDSISSDRLYNAKQMGSIFDGLILDGVYPNYGDAFEVLEDTGMDVTVGIGRAWFNHTWSYNDALLGVTVPTADALLDRIDIVYLEIDESIGVRANSIDILEGTPASTPVPPILTNTSTIHQYALAHIYVGASVTSIVQANITDMVGTVDTPFVELVTISEDMQAQIYAIVGDTNPPLLDLIDLKVHNHDGSPTVQLLASGLATNAVETAKIKNLNVTSAKLAADAVETAKIKNLNVTSAKLAADAVIAGKIADGAVDVTASLANDIVTSAKIGVGALMALYHQGGSATSWITAGSTNYAVADPIKIQCGAVAITLGVATASHSPLVTFPEAWKAGTVPIVVSVMGAWSGNLQYDIIHYATSVDNNSFNATVSRGVTSNAISMVVYWIAIGPE